MYAIVQFVLGVIDQIFYEMINFTVCQRTCLPVYRIKKVMKKKYGS